MSELTNIFTDIADSIRNKMGEGVLTTWQPSSFASAINNIPTGGGGNNITELPSGITLQNCFNMPVIVNSQSTNMNNAFMFFTEFNQSIEVPKNVQYITNTFYECKNFNSSVTFEENSNALFLIRTFFNCKNFNLPIELPQKVIDMQECFKQCSNFNQPINFPYSLDRATSCFRECYNFNQPINMNVIGTNLYGMFSYCYNLNMPINITLESNITTKPNHSLAGFIQQCNNFNAPININIKTNNIQTMNYYQMFYACRNFDQPCNFFNIDCDNLLISQAFCGCENFNQPININANFNSITGLTECFRECQNLNSPITILNMTNSLNFQNFFYNCRKFNSQVTLTTRENTTGIIAPLMFCQCFEYNQPTNFPEGFTGFGNAFQTCYNLNSPVSFPNTTILMNFAFVSCNNYNQPVYVPENVTSVRGMLLGCTNFGSVIHFNNSNKITNCHGMLQSCNNDLRKEIHVGVGGNMTPFLKSGTGSVTTYAMTQTTNDVCAWNEAYNIYIYNDR